jgi:hypothetical protein
MSLGQLFLSILKEHLLKRWSLLRVSIEGDPSKLLEYANEAN